MLNQITKRIYEANQFTLKQLLLKHGAAQHILHQFK